jgi:hypothetical protein
MGNRRAAVLIHDLIVRSEGRGRQRHTPAALPLETNPVPTAWEVWWASLWVRVCAEILEISRFQTPKFPARSYSLY